MELIDDWTRPAATVSRRKAPSAGAAVAELTPQAIGDRLAGFEPEILQVNCYEDVGHRWIQVAFGSTINPGVALRVGMELAALAGDEHVLLNSLRPKAVFYLLVSADSDLQPDLPASRYGVPVREIEQAWEGPSTGKAKAVARKRASP